ncbi:efflux transporter outer membrane subunit [Burkholderia pseudomallei]|uniref:efflux transporter outer membrane subunit n=2 Tax=Burkholderia pseudomallei TaxID=28450 RepID=UPI000E6966A4|nr:efflux transporter outer membrane subunit [Burkholderia pseudomallei]
MRVSIPSLPSLAPRALAAAAAIAFAGALAGCSLFALSDAPPAMPSPAHYGATPLPERTAAAQGLAQRFDVGAQPVPDWWTRYRSPALDALVDEGLRNSPTLAAAEKSLSAAREQLRAQIGSSLLPTIDAGGQATRERALGMPAFGPQTVLYNVFAGQLQASYTLDLFGAARFANRALSKRVDVNAYQLESARRALAANIVTAAVTSAALAEQVATTERLVALAREQASDAAARHRLGAASRTDMLNTRQSAAALEASLPALRQQAQSARHALAVLLGRTPDAAPANLALADLHLPQDVPVVVPSTLLQARPDIRAAEAGLQAAAAEVGVATAQMFPQLSLSASMGHAGFKWPAMLSGAGAIWSVGASLTQPLFHGGALLAQRRAARASYDAAVDQYKQTVLAAFQDVADKLAALENDASALDASNRSAVAARGAFDDTAARVRLGALPERIRRAANGAAVVETSAGGIVADVVVAGIGVVPNVELAQAAGLDVDDGVCVDEMCRTADPAIFAAGEVTRHFNPLVGRALRIESWQIAENQPAVAAANMLGAAETYAQWPWLWSDQYDSNLQTLGLFGGERTLVLRGSPERDRAFCVFALNARRELAAVAAVNAGREIAVCRRLMTAGVALDPARLADPSDALRAMLPRGV